MSIPIEQGAVLPLAVYWFDISRSDLVVRAQVYQRYPLQLLHEDVLLSYVPGSDAVYTNNTIMMPFADVVDVLYEVFDSDGTTSLAKDDEEFVKQIAGGGGGSGTIILSPPVSGVVKSDSQIKGTVVCEKA
jgi:hypothetical protein